MYDPIMLLESTLSTEAREISATFYVFHFHIQFFLVSPVRYCFLPPHILGQYCMGEVIATTYSLNCTMELQMLTFSE